MSPLEINDRVRMDKDGPDDGNGPNAQPLWEEGDTGFVTWLKRTGRPAPWQISVVVRLDNGDTVNCFASDLTRT